MKLFSYGTLQDPIIQIQWLGRLLNRRPASINGWHKTTIELDGGVYPAIKQGNEQIWGSILEIDEEDFTALDTYEGPAYKRITTHTSAGDLVSVYILANGYRGNSNKNKKTQKNKSKTKIS